MVTQLVAFLVRSRTSSIYHFPVPQTVEDAIQQLQATEAKPSAEALHRLFMEIWTQRWDTMPGVDTIHCPTHRFLALTSLNKDGVHADTKDITPRIARLKYCMRVAFLREIKQRSALFHAHQDDLACDELQHWFKEKVISPFNTLCTLQHYATHITLGTMAMPKIWWTDRQSWTKLLYEGQEVDIRGVRDLMQALELDAIRLWEEDVLMGLPIPNLQLENLAEDLTNTSLGYGPLSDPRNAHLTAAHRRLLLDSICKSPIHRERFLHSSQTLSWNREELHGWLKSYSQFQALLLLRCHMLGGGPGRMTEVTSMSYRSSTTRRQRNLSVMGKYVVLLTTYVKLG